MSEQTAVPDKMVPHNVEAERAVLGALLIDPDAHYKVNTFLRPEDFYVTKHQWMYESMRDLQERGEAVDYVTLCDDLERREQLTEIGGAAYITSLINATPTALNVEYYGHIVERTSTLRQLIGAAGQIATLAYEDTNDASEVVDRAEQILFGISQKHIARDLVPVRDVVSAYYDRVDYLFQHKGETIGVPTGFRQLDKLLGGLQKSDLIIVAARPGMGKCVTADTRLVDPQTGSLCTIETLVQQRRARLLTLGDGYRLQASEASDFVDDGIKPVYSVRTALGREIKVTLTHPFLTINGWRPLGELDAGQKVAVPRRIPVFGLEDPPECQVKVLAYLLADGSLTGTSPRFTNSNPALRQDFTSAALHFPGTKSRVYDSHGRRTPTVYVAKDPDFVKTQRQDFARRLKAVVEDEDCRVKDIAGAVGVTAGAVRGWLSGDSAPSPQHFGRLTEYLQVSPQDIAPYGIAAIGTRCPSSLTVWLQEQKVWGKSALEKVVPDCVFRYDQQSLALFLNRLFACDGSVYLQQGKQGVVSYTTVSYHLAQDVHHLLLRFGILSKLRHRRIKYDGGHRTAYQLRITGVSNLAQFVEQIGVYGKEEAVQAIRVYVQSTSSNINLDIIPIQVWDQIKIAKGERTWRSVYDDMGLPAGANIHAGVRAPSRERLMDIAVALRSDELEDLAQSDVYWDQIVEIRYLGERQVYDLTVPGTHNFVADDMIVHNTALMLALAQNAARKYNQRVAVFSLEMSAEQLVQRLIASETGIDSQRLRLGNLREEEWPIFIQATGALSETMLFIDDTPSISDMQLRTKARRLYAERGLDLIIVDYLQLMQTDRRIDNRVQEISLLSRSLKGLARELNVPVVVGSQLSRAVEQRNDKRPMLSDLRESGSIEQDADIVTFIYRDEYYTPETEQPNIAEILISKHRNGPTGMVPLYFQKELAKFREVEIFHQELDF
ncbi:MAG: replicative DNA helicase [Anaerolineae bacterium]|nr:replicative DNA helicase [Anaerolineae bacterium]